MTHDHARDTYYSLLKEYVAHQDELPLVQAADLGRSLMSHGVPPEEVADIHQSCVEELGLQQPELTLGNVAPLIALPLYEMLMAYGIAFREQMAFREKRQRANLEAVTEQSSDLVMITNTQGQLEYVNKAFLDTTGYQLDECIGLTPGELIGSGREPASFYQELWETINSGGAWHGQVADRTKSGDLFVLDSSIFPLRDFNGNITQFVSISRNVTQRVELERSVQEKTQRLEGIATLAAGINHDLNNLLGMIMGYTDLVKADPMGDNAQANLHQIGVAAERGRELAAKTLAFTRQDAERTDQKVMPGEMVHEVSSLLQVTAGHMIKIATQIDSAGVEVRMHPSQLHQVLMNLGINAIQSMAQEGGNLLISTGQVDHLPALLNPKQEQGNYVLIRVRDSGPGIHPDSLRKVFDPFYTTKQDSGGTGLGLSVVRTIIERCDGRIDVSSVVGEFTEFRVYLPIADSEEAEQAEHLSSDEVSVKTDTKPLTKAKSVLHVDDEKVILDIVAQDLKRRGFDIVSFESPWDALLEMHKHGERYYALITDLQMSGMDGVEMVERINKLGRSLPVVLCTGNPSAIEHERAASAGIKNIMHKPIDTHGLADLLTSWMEAEPEDVSGA
ncbi:MAG: ATP-binding protein [Candidatus Thiodiazotropha sp.]